MFEERTDILRDHIAYLKGILDEEPSEEMAINKEELEAFLNSCNEDISNLQADLPYDEIDEDDIPIEDFSGDNLDDTEIEDEVVEVEAVIKELLQLMESAKERFLEDDVIVSNNCQPTMKNASLSESEFRQKLEAWLIESIKKKCDANGISKSDEEIKEMSAKFISYAAENKGNPYPHFSIGLYHITFEELYDYRLLKKLLNFNNTMAQHIEFWGNLI